MCLLVLGCLSICMYVCTYVCTCELFSWLLLPIYFLCSLWIFLSLDTERLGLHLTFSHVFFLLFHWFVFLLYFLGDFLKRVSPTLLLSLFLLSHFSFLRTFFFSPSDGSVLKEQCFCFMDEMSFISLRILMNCFWSFYFLA